MASLLPPPYGVAFAFDVVLFAQSDNQIKTTPTLAAGDFVIAKASGTGDMGATANLTTTPSEAPASSGIVKVALSATEMEADRVFIRWKDASGDEWHSGSAEIFTAGQTFDTMDANIDSVLEDTGTTIPGTLTTIDGIVDDILVDTGTTLDTLIKDVPTVDEFEARTIAAASYFDPAADTVANVTTVATVTNDVNMATAQAGSITAASFAPSAIDAAAVAADAGVEIAAAVWDRVLSAALHNIANSAGRRLRTLQVGGNYEDGAIWIDTVNGTAGTVVDENGTVTNPVDSLADALTISASNNLKILAFYPGSSITLAAALEGYALRGMDTNVALGGQSIDGSSFYDCDISGIGTAAVNRPEFYNCAIAATTLAPAILVNCVLTSTLTIGSAGDFRLIDCASGVAGSPTPTIDFAAGVGATTLSIRRWSGGMTFANLGAGDVVSIEGMGGSVIVGGTGGEVYVRGIFNAITDNSAGAVTIGQTALVNRTTINAEADTALTDYDAATGAEVAALNDLDATEVQTAAEAALTAYTAATAAQVAAVTAPSAASVADAVWDEALAGHATAGSAGAQLTAAGNAGDPWSSLLPAAYAEGTAGYLVGTMLDARISTLCEGLGVTQFTYTLTEAVSGDPIVAATVTVTSDAEGTDVIAHGITNASGEVLFYLNPGTYYLWRQKAGFTFTNPDTEVVA